MTVLVIDGANVVGSRPDGWWRDRAGAAHRLHARLVAAREFGMLDHGDVVLVLEGAARAGPPEGEDGGLRTVHAPGSGDDALVAEVTRMVAAAPGGGIVVVTADRGLRDRVEAAGASCRSPGWLQAILDHVTTSEDGEGTGPDPAASDH